MIVTKISFSEQKKLEFPIFSTQTHDSYSVNYSTVLIYFCFGIYISSYRF